MQFRNLKANEIDVRVGIVKYNTDKDKNSGIKGITLLLYKDARVDMTLLDESVGSMNWQRKHEFKDGKLYCSVGIYDVDKKEWVWKEDVGIESNTEAEKGQASDSFKRACVNWGIGRCLYTAPFIYIKPLPKENMIYTKFFVKNISYNENNEIVNLVIVDNNNLVRYSLQSPIEPNENVQQNNVQQGTFKGMTKETIIQLNELKIDVELLADYLKKPINQISDEEAQIMIKKTKERRRC